MKSSCDIRLKNAKTDANGNRKKNEKGISVRKYYIDNLRNAIILLLFAVHTFMIWNDFGSRFYIWVSDNHLLSTLIVFVNPWFMPILFVIAGMSARYSLEKRSVKKFIEERMKKLFIPFVCGMVFLVPLQTLYARKYYYDYKGSLIAHFKYFYTHFTDLSGYDGAFTPGHLWFILFLFLISLLALWINKFLPYEKVEKYISKLNIWVIAGLFIPVWLMYYLGNFGGFSIGKCFALYLIGYYILSNDDIMVKLQKYRKPFFLIYVIAEAVLVAAYYRSSYYGDLLVNFVGWMGILALMMFAKNHLDKRTAFTAYFNKASFPVYILHQSILVVLAYYVLKAVNDLFLQIGIIMIGSFGLTLLCYELIKNIPYVRNMIGISSKP